MGYTKVPIGPVRRVKISPNANGYTYEVGGSAVASFTVNLSQPSGAKRLIGRLEGVRAGSCEYWQLRPNASTSTQSNLHSFLPGTGVSTGTRDSQGLVLAFSGDTGTTGCKADFVLDLAASPLLGFRHCISEFVNDDGSNGIVRSGQWYSSWASSAALTSVVINTEVATGVGAGTRLTLWWEVEG